MFSVKSNIQQLTVLMLKAGITQVVVCPGSRNAAIVHTFHAAGMQCYDVTDERSAGFFAIGLMEANGGKPVAVCVTSGSAVLNLAPAVSEAYYRSFPLMVISADRPLRWIGQMDGQTLPQQGAFGSLVSKSVSLPEPQNEEEQWHCNRLLNEVLIEMQRTHKPVHVNVPIAEPLFDFSAESLPECRSMEWVRGGENLFQLSDSQQAVWQRAEKVLVLIGQMLPAEVAACAPLLSQLAKQHCLICAEHLSNVQTVMDERHCYIGNFDEMLASHAFESPDLLITIGGHIVSKLLKQHMRTNPPQWHWHVSPQGEVADLFMCCTTLVEAQPKALLSALCAAEQQRSAQRKTYRLAMMANADAAHEKEQWEDEFCDLSALRMVMKDLSALWHLQVANSSMIRNVQLLNFSNPVHCNRGVNGIEGSVSVAVGYWAGSGAPTLLLTGDLSFFYDKNGLWNKYVQNPSAPLRILVMNNRGGQIFHHLQGLDSPYLEKSIAAQHDTTAQGVAMECRAQYLCADSAAELELALKEFLDEAPTVKILEVMTDVQANLKAHKAFFRAFSN